MGVSNLRIVGMILLQALVVGVIGYGLGVGLAAAVLRGDRASVDAPGGASTCPGRCWSATGVAVLVIVLLASLLSIRKVLVLEPAIVFRG